VIAKEGGGYRGEGTGTGTGKQAGDRSREGARNRNRKGTSVGDSEAKGTKCDRNERDQAGGARNEAETNRSQTGNKPELAESERTLTEMLKLTTDLHTQSMSDQAFASNDTFQSVNPGFIRGHVFTQLGVNYQWNEIVLDKRLDSKKNVNGRNKVYTPYGNGDEPIQAGDRAPDAPNLILIPIAEDSAPTTMTALDLLTPFLLYCTDIQAPRKSSRRTP
jgi:hypothetical protein